MYNRELRIRAYLGDGAAREKLHHATALDIADLLQDGVMPLEPQFEGKAKELVDALMRRARQNVELLVGRLEKAGYLFLNRDYFEPPQADASARLDAFENKTGLYVPLVYRSWFEIVGRVCLMGTHPDWPEITYNGLGGRGPAVCADPLVVYWTPEFGLSEWEWRTGSEGYGSDRATMLEFAPDPGHKANYSSAGSYHLSLRSERIIDGRVENDDDPKYRRTFLNHLREAFSHGGFPGWFASDNAPIAPIASLTELSKGFKPL